MNDWLTDAAGPAVLVTVARVEGSAPREAGTKMLVTADAQYDTVGGGHLEMRATTIAREILGSARVQIWCQAPDLDTGTAVRYERFPLGPSLGQCCGGVVWLAFELVHGHVADILQALRERRGEDSWRITALDGAAATALFDAEGKLLAGAENTPRFDRSFDAYLMKDDTGRSWLVDPCLAPRAQLLLFGAGHVGAAIVRAMADLPCRITWVDEREDLFPAEIPPNAVMEISDTPQALVAQAPAGASYLVMTHSHALDQALTEAILARGDIGWFGLIGSATKRKQFENRLLARGFNEDRLKEMVCPIGLPGIINKAPAVIAASVCAQLLTVWEAQSLLRP
ncbi:xanthine dehydrogenase accessory protein XdhC [Massilia endophytica]|uniref:xanthine dehydrogenase accessory protein XdhC n=1 Tax=Massilia endophytica TaxID=2899220 RepID=UPI001E584FCB|nr:xanthine dehydrogenase accessory protein XdhC [Massilia endophytica]UGQ47237.1 xanthine dehydrogenase accessory protein XdhC [Massilia endophytica]